MMDEITGFDSLLLLLQYSGSLKFGNWLDSMNAIAELFTKSRNDSGIDPQILDILFDGIWITNKDDIIIFANNAMAKISGIPKDTIVGTTISNSLSTVFFKNFIPFYLKAKDRKSPIRFDPMPILASPGKLTHQTGWLIPKYTNSNSFKGIICSVRDVTESKMFSQSEAKCNAICNSSPDCIMLINLEGNIRYMNHDLPGLFPKNSLGANFLNLIPLSYRNEVEICMRRVRNSKTPDRTFMEYPTQEGTTVYVESRISPLIQEEKLVALIVNTSNITRENLLEKELKQQKATLEETNITLKVLLKRLEKEKLLFQENLSTNILCNIEPYMTKLKQCIQDKDQKKTLDILDQNIKDMASPLIYSVMTMNLRLTPAEMQVSNFIRQGYSSKEIAELLNISPATIDKHRKNIRKKLGITNKKQNLRSVLSSLSS